MTNATARIMATKEEVMNGQQFTAAGSLIFVVIFCSRNRPARTGARRQSTVSEHGPD